MQGTAGAKHLLSQSLTLSLPPCLPPAALRPRAPRPPRRPSLPRQAARRAARLPRPPRAWRSRRRMQRAQPPAPPSALASGPPRRLPLRLRRASIARRAAAWRGLLSRQRRCAGQAASASISRVRSPGRCAVTVRARQPALPCLRSGGCRGTAPAAAAAAGEAGAQAAGALPGANPTPPAGGQR